jgi:hypothetical protein
MAYYNLYAHLNKERAKKNFPTIDERFSCKKRVKEKLSDEYFNKFKGKSPRQIAAAGCGFAVSSYISNYYDDFSLTKVRLNLLVDSGNEEGMVEFSNQFCSEVACPKSLMFKR